MALNTLDRDTLLRKMAQQDERIKRLEKTLQGQEMSGVKIKNLSWDKGSGGTLRLGGENDTDGSLNVYDAFNVLKARLDKNGLAFASNAISGGSDGAYQYFGASPGGTISPTEQTLTLTNQTKVFCIWTGTVFIRSSTNTIPFSGNAIVQLNVDGSNVYGRNVRIGVNNGTYDSANFAPFTYFNLVTLDAGEHTLKFVAWCDTSNTGEMGVYSSQYAYIDVGAVLS